MTAVEAALVEVEAVVLMRAEAEALRKTKEEEDNWGNGEVEEALLGRAAARVRIVTTLERLEVLEVLQV